MLRSPFDFPENLIAAGSMEDSLLARVDPGSVPRHVAIIMDGNGRWAAERGMPRIMGHREGVKSVHSVVESCARLGVDVLTIFAFSVENWKRPQREIKALMRMLSEFLAREIKTLVKNDICFRPIGRWRELPAKTVDDIERGIAQTKACRKMLFQVALNYGGRVEIVDACKSLAQECVEGNLKPEQIDVKAVRERLYSPDVPDPDLMIRTSGEFRISNFLLWELAYTEIYVTDLLWPDFRLRDLLEAVIDFQSRERRYGGLNEGGGAK